MKKLLVSFVFVCFLTITFCQFAYADPVYPETYGKEKKARGEDIIFDAIVLRPLGIASLIIGLAGTIISAPFAGPSQSFDVVVDELLEKPVDFTFKRPLGDLNFNH